MVVDLLLSLGRVGDAQTAAEVSDRTRRFEEVHACGVHRIIVAATRAAAMLGDSLTAQA